MEAIDLLTRTAHVLGILAVILLLAWAGRAAARLLRQPEVIGEITAGLLAGPVALHLLGQGAFDAVLPGPVLDTLKLISKAALALFLVGLAHKLHAGPAAPPRRTTAWVAAGSLVPPLLSGLLLAGLVLVTDDTAARGDAPTASFVLMVAVAMSITAVPVMARILTDRGMSESSAGRVALGAAITVDGVGWLLCMLAISLGEGSLGGFLHSALALLIGAGCALAIRFALRTGLARTAYGKTPRTVAMALAVATLAVAIAMEKMGMTAIVGAALVGFAIPRDEDAPWAPAVDGIARSGRYLVPAFFVVTGVTVLNGSFSQASWLLILATFLLACVGKGIGGYLGARLGGTRPATARRVAVLMNTRGLTELIVLQAGLSAGILTAPLVLALVVMALATTALTGPFLDLLDLLDHRERRASVPAGSPAPAGEPQLVLATEGSPR
ncbi:cation:proton antiporter [Streptomyces sp. ISL-86]|uniref:cation:proton antiporter n=1 Tax=Streptomyces sp. ISL-86 TaxID=2819187 RepID=UPI001BE646A2|nr:cation:proton antiporter [Streptomyces sp. ISL-86]MBT2454405.1 cation:proton antiporter [Streptomyces sp. ISL-86]